LWALILALLLVGMAALAPGPVSAEDGGANWTIRDPSGVRMEGSGGGEPDVSSTEPSGDGVEGVPLGSPGVLWDQPSAGTRIIADQYLSDWGQGVYDADDFSNTQPWNIESIFVDGRKWDTASGSLPQADSLNWLIYPNALPGVPAGYPDIGGELWSYSCLPTAPEVTLSGADSDKVTLDIVLAQGGPLYLPPGTYWLCFYPSLNFGLYGQWGWSLASTTYLATAQIIDPYDIFGYNYTSWTPWTALNSTFHDAAFRLEGTEVWEWEFGDAPEEALAYPSTGVTGAFPTCKNVTISGWIQHNNFGTWFGPGFDMEPDGNHGLCPGFAPYDNDECFQDGDAGLIRPQPYTIQGGAVVPCGGSACEYEICLVDSYGDGWTGGTVDVFVNGNPEYTGLTLASGYGPECHPIPVGSGDEITVHYTAGGWPSENEYYIYDLYGVLVRSEGTGGVTPGDVLPGQLYAACPPPFTPGAPLGDICQLAQWGSDIDILIHNWMPNHEPYLPGYVNVLIDWNQDGQWQNDPATTCGGSMVPEHVLVDFVIPPQYDGTLSALGPPAFQIGPNAGYVWARFSITEDPVDSNWIGEGNFEDGETEDYLLKVYEPPPGPRGVPTMNQWGMVALITLFTGLLMWAVRRRRLAS